MLNLLTLSIKDPQMAALYREKNHRKVLRAALAMFIVRIALVVWSFILIANYKKS